jgi:DNA-binding MurR/RpiR family transcriptional regulator
VITDSTVSTLLQSADHKLITGLPGEFVYSSTIGAFNIAIAIIHSFIKLGGEEYKEKLDETQKLMAKKNIWY